MIFNFKTKLKDNFKLFSKNNTKSWVYPAPLLRFKSGAGITLIEILVVISIMILLSGILIADFPKIKRQFAITRSVYKMSQDIRRAQDMGFSGEQLKDVNGNIVRVKGYGVYLNLDRLGPKKYIIYADMDGDYRYTITTEVGDILCNDPGYSELKTGTDCVIETIDFSQAEPGVSITNILNIVGADGEAKKEVDINFMPPNPTITITDLVETRVHITFSLDSDSLISRTVFVNTAGLIEIQ